MTEMQIINHAAPLAPGEIRAYTVGARTFRVMHVAGGSFTQATVHEIGQPTRVLKTDVDTRAAVQVYAEAVEQAESDVADHEAERYRQGAVYVDPAAAALAAEALSYNLPDGASTELVHGEPAADGTTHLDFRPFGQRISTAPTVRLGDGTPDVERDGDETPAELLAIIRDDLRRYAPGGGEQFLDRYLAAVREQLRERIEAYGEAVARGAIHLTMDSESTSGQYYAAQADEIKTGILRRFGGANARRS